LIIFNPFVKEGSVFNTDDEDVRNQYSAKKYQ